MVLMRRLRSAKVAGSGAACSDRICAMDEAPRSMPTHPRTSTSRKPSQLRERYCMVRASRGLGRRQLNYCGWRKKSPKLPGHNCERQRSRQILRTNDRVPKSTGLIRKHWQALPVVGRGITDEIRHGMIAALVSHGRPIAELLKTHPEGSERDLQGQVRKGWRAYRSPMMTISPRLTGLMETIRSNLTPNDRAFLVSFETGDPDWGLFPLDGLDELPGPQFKLLNVRKFRAREARFVHAQNLAALQDICLTMT